MFIRTERLFLRPAWPEDHDELKNVLDEGPVFRTYSLGKSGSRAETLEEYLLEPRDPRFPHLYMYLRAPGDARLVGGISLEQRGADAELRYWMVRRFLGRGYAGEAVRAVMTQACMLGHDRIVASQRIEGDEAAALALESAGFVFRGEGVAPGRMSGERAVPVFNFTADLVARRREGGIGILQPA